MPNPHLSRCAAALGVAALLAGCGTLKPPEAPAPATPAAPARELPPSVSRIEPPARDIPGIEALPPGVPEAAPVQTGIASWYGRRFHGRRTANGERYDMHALTAAHRTLPMPSFAWVRNPANGREVIVRINDRGPFTRGRILDLSWAAAQVLGIHGVATVELRPLRIEEVQAADDPR